MVPVLFFRREELGERERNCHSSERSAIKYRGMTIATLLNSYAVPYISLGRNGRSANFVFLGPVILLNYRDDDRDYAEKNGNWEILSDLS